MNPHAEILKARSEKTPHKGRGKAWRKGLSFAGSKGWHKGMVTKKQGRGKGWRKGISSTPGGKSGRKTNTSRSQGAHARSRRPDQKLSLEVSSCALRGFMWSELDRACLPTAI